MNVNDEDIDLGLNLGPKNYRIQTRLSNSRGAGVNANSTADMAFAASDPLSELVWSPQNGLSLKCADSSLAGNKPFLLWNVGLNCSALSASQSTRSQGSRDEKCVDHGKLSASRAIIDANDRFGNKATLVTPSRSCPGGSNDEVEEESGTKDAIHKGENMEDAVQENIFCSENVVDDIDESVKRNADAICDSKDDVKKNEQFSSKIIKETCCYVSSKINGSTSDAIHSGAHAIKLSEACVFSLPNLKSGKEPEDEVTSAMGEVNKDKTNSSSSILPPPLMKLESSAENDLCDLTAKEAVETGFQCENPPPGERSPTTDSRVRLYREKGKEKALSDGDLCGRSSNDEDESHESVESCNSGGLFSKGIKRRSECDQDSIVESKRTKKEIQESHGSASITRYRSSFMNWILNMVKGLSDSNKEESSSLALANARSGNAFEKDKESFICNQTHDSASLNMGFQTVFHSLYCQNAKNPRAGGQRENDLIQESKELTMADKTSVESLPRLCDGNKDNSCYQIVVSNEEPSPRIPESDLAANKASNVVVSDRSRGGIVPFRSLDKPVNSIAKDTSVSIPLETNNMPENRNPLTSLWITRFCTKTVGSDNCNRIIEESRKCSMDSLKVSLDLRANDVCPINQKSPETRKGSAEELIFVANAEPSVDPKSANNISPILPSEKLRSSEDMASVFAKRLDALRYITSSGKRNSSTSTSSCFFCGKSGHDLRDCPEVTEAELDTLLAKTSSFDRVENCSRKEEDWKLSAPRQTECSSRKRRLGLFPSYLSWDVNKPSSKRVLASNGIQKSTSSNSETEMFYAISKLRLSRADILRWMKSSTPLSHLNGFFLRLRLGKVKAGGGGTGYYVACINGETIENIGCKSKNTISVDVGGIKSSVGSQYVSNQDFLEEEIKTWWQRVVKSGCKVPSLDELKAKLDDRRSLGF